MSIDHFVRTPLPVEGAYTFTAIRPNHKIGEPHGDLVEFFNVIKNTTDPAMMQINVSRSKKNVIRGIHMSAFHKVVFCPVGKIYDVLVDLRPNSPTFMKWAGAWLDPDVHIYVPAYCAHGVFAAEDDSVISYYQGGTFFPNLDYAVRYNDPQIGIEWPKPIDSDKYVVSEKDSSSSPVTPELIEKIKFRMEHPIEDRLTTTNSDFVVVGSSMESVIPIFEELEAQGLKGHHCVANALQRETLDAQITSMRPKFSVIYFLDIKPNRTSMDNFIEVMNIVHICVRLGNHVTIVSNSASFAGINDLLDLLGTDLKSNVLFLAENAPIPSGLSKKNLAELLKYWKESLVSTPSFTDVSALAKFIVKMSKDQVIGQYRLMNKGSIEFDTISKFCSEQGVDIGPNAHYVRPIHLPPFPETEETEDATAAFQKIISSCKN